MKKKKNKKAEVVYYNTENLLSLKWMDKREVCMLTTLHSNKMMVTRKKDKNDNDIMKPVCILNYNSNMRAVDRTDMLQSSIESV